ncbi:MAG: RraA family protein, partial [Pseudomonadota bacterium]
SWCTGLNPGSPYATGPGKVGLPVQIGGQNVETGDMIVADKDGIVVVPFDMLDSIIGRLDAVTELEHDMDRQVADGLCVPDSIEQMLQDTDNVMHVT